MTRTHRSLDSSVRRVSIVAAVLTFGLGKSRQADRVRVFWPGAKTPQKLGSVPAGTTRVVRQP